MSVRELIDSEADAVFTPDAKPITSDAPPSEPVEFLDVPNGTCKVCGVPATSKYGKYCSEHKGMYDKRKTRHQKDGDSQPKYSAPKSKKDLKADLTASFTMVGMLWSMAPPQIAPEDMQRIFPELSPEDIATIQHPGSVMVQQAESLAGAFAHLADQNPRIAKWLTAASQPSGYIGVIMAGFPIANAALAWHKMVIPRVKQLNQEMTNAGA